MKKALDIISIADLSVLALWAAFLTLSKIFPETEFFSAAGLQADVFHAAFGKGDAGLKIDRIETVRMVYYCGEP